MPRGIPKVKRERVLNTNVPYSVYLVTYLCRVETDQFSLYTAQGILTDVVRKTRLIERDCVIQAQGIEDALREIQETDDCFVRMLQYNMVQPRTVVHILDRATNYVEKA